DGEGDPLEARAFGPDGGLYITSIGLKEILVCDAQGKTRTFAKNCDGSTLVVRHDGTVYAAPYGPGDDFKGHIWSIGPKGDKKSNKLGVFHAGGAGGLALSPDQTLLYLAPVYSRWIYSYQIQPDGSLAHGQRYYQLQVPETEDIPGLTRGLAVDRDGRL